MQKEKQSVYHKRPLLLVEWDDISSSSSWSDEDDISMRVPLRSLSVGWKVPGDKKCLTIAASRCAKNKRCADTTTIPRHNIVSIRRLEDATNKEGY